ncbi:MAG: hypothetical protein LBH41_00595 [Rickettsiales bacterium]|nr:hypothetical protein [Rickettsiales bacterium]
MRRWVFLPVMRSMDERRDRLAREEEAAGKAREEALNIRDDLAKKQAAFKRRSERALELGEAELALARETKIREFNEALAARWAKFDAEMEAEKAAALRKLADGAAGAVLDATARAADALYGASLEEAVAARFAELLSSRKAEGLDQLRRFYSLNKLVTVRAPFPMRTKRRALLKKSIAAALKIRSARVLFKPDKSMLCGIALECGDLELVFGLDNYIERLRGEINKLK